MRIRWFGQARRDLNHQIRYIALSNPSAAIDQDILIMRAVERLVEYPEIGRLGRVNKTREFVVAQTSYIILYRLMPAFDEIQILRILHAKQKYPPE